MRYNEITEWTEKFMKKNRVCEHAYNDVHSPWLVLPLVICHPQLTGLCSSSEVACYRNLLDNSKMKTSSLHLLETDCILRSVNIDFHYLESSIHGALAIWKSKHTRLRDELLIIFILYVSISDECMLYCKLYGLLPRCRCLLWPLSITTNEKLVISNSVKTITCAPWPVGFLANRWDFFTDYCPQRILTKTRQKPEEAT